MRLSVAERQKTLRIFGNRLWQNGAITAPQPFESMPIVYEYAFGGTHEVDSDQPDQTTLDQSIQAIVDGGHGNFWHLLFGPHEDLLGGGMVPVIQQDVVDLFALRGGAQPSAGQAFH